MNRIGLPILAVALLHGAIACVGALAGCAENPRAAQRANTQEALIAGLAAFDTNDFERASQLLDVAISSGTLQPDALAQASTKRAISLAYHLQFVEAHAVLDRVASGAPDQSEVHAARAFIFRRQGDTTAADRQFAEARRQNPRIKPFDK